MTRSARGRRGESGGIADRAAAPERTENSAKANETAPGRGRFGGMWHSFLYDRSVRSRVGVLVFIPLLGALLLGTFLFRDALDRATAAGAVERNARVTATALSTIAELQDERDISGLFETNATGADFLARARNDADKAIARLDQQIEGLSTTDGSAMANAVRSTQVQLRLLDSYRGSRDIELEPYDLQGVEKYELVNEALLRFIKSTAADAADADLVNSLDALDSLTRATESASVERGLLAHVLGVGDPELTDTEKQREAIFRGEQDYLLTRYASTAEPAIRADYFNDMPEVRGPVEEIRNGVLADSDGGQPVATDSDGNTYPVTQTGWYETATDRIDVMRGLQQTLANKVVSDAAAIASSARWTAIIAAVAVLTVLTLTVILAVFVARSIIGPLRRLRSATLDAAERGLPALVSRINADGPAVVRQIGDAVTPEGSDEIGQLATAFNAVHSTAVRVAGEQALLRQNLDTIVVNLSRRTQGLIDRQLGEIEDLEARERDPDQLGTLFRIDHLATRVRRHAESLLVLAGVEEMRRQGTAAPVLDVVRTAVGEVEQYPRVKFGVMPTDLVVPAAVDDVAHLLAELLDNATEFSAPSTQVTVTSQPLLGGGLRLQVTDSGLGVPPDQLNMLNERLREPGDIDVASSRTLGIYVVARLAARHGITVRLIPAENTNGTIAQVDLPAHLVVSPLDTSDGVIQAVRPDLGNRQQQTAHATGSLFDEASQRTESPPARSWSQQPAQAWNEQPAGAQPVAENRRVQQPPRAPEPRRSRDTPQRQPEQPRPARPSGAPAGAPTPVPAPQQPTRPGPGIPTTQQPPRPTQPVAGTNGMSAREIARSGDTADPGGRSLRGAEPDLPRGDSPIYDAVRSAWFSKGSSLDWSSPADEGWRRAAAALRNAEEAANARRGTQPAATPAAQPYVPPVPRPATPAPPVSRPGTPAPPPRPARPAPAQPSQHPQPTSRPAAPPAQQPGPPQPQRPQQPWTGGGAPGPAAQPAARASGLPTRQRGATLIPGSIAEVAGENAQRRDPTPKDAGNVASTLSSLQRGVKRGRSETGGWVPKRPSDSERSNP